jgi:DNA polymerase-3 subunit gamma/tau
MLEQNIQKIVSFLSKVCHSQMNFEVTLEEETSQTKQADFPPQVKIVCSAFKGSILGADGGN